MKKGGVIVRVKNEQDDRDVVESLLLGDGMAACTMYGWLYDGVDTEVSTDE